MSMDHLYEELESFITMLGQCNEDISKEWDNLQVSYDRANEVWDDATAREFEKRWLEVATAIKIYREDHSQRYMEFLMQRKWALDEYFGR